MNNSIDSAVRSLSRAMRCFSIASKEAEICQNYLAWLLMTHSSDRDAESVSVEFTRLTGIPITPERVLEVFERFEKDRK